MVNGNYLENLYYLVEKVFLKGILTVTCYNPQFIIYIYNPHLLFIGWIWINSTFIEYLVPGKVVVIGIIKMISMGSICLKGASLSFED